MALLGLNRWPGLIPATAATTHPSLTNWLERGRGAVWVRMIATYLWFFWGREGRKSVPSEPSGPLRIMIDFPSTCSFISAVAQAMQTARWFRSKVASISLIVFHHRELRLRNTYLFTIVDQPCPQPIFITHRRCGPRSFPQRSLEPARKDAREFPVDYCFDSQALWINKDIVLSEIVVAEDVLLLVVFQAGFGFPHTLPLPSSEEAIMRADE